MCSGSVSPSYISAANGQERQYSFSLPLSFSFQQLKILLACKSMSLWGGRSAVTSQVGSPIFFHASQAVNSQCTLSLGWSALNHRPSTTLHAEGEWDIITIPREHCGHLSLLSLWGFQLFIKKSLIFYWRNRRKISSSSISNLWPKPQVCFCFQTQEPVLPEIRTYSWTLEVLHEISLKSHGPHQQQYGDPWLCAPRPGSSNPSQSTPAISAQEQMELWPSTSPVSCMSWA